MKIIHDDAIYLESLVKKVHNCDRGGMAGLIDADNFENNPLEAVLISLSVFWKNIPETILESFVEKWLIFGEDNLDFNINDLKKEFSELIKEYY